MVSVNSCASMSRRALALHARRFLFELANIQDHEGALRRLQSRYPDLVEISAAIQLARFWAIHVEEEPTSLDGRNLSCFASTGSSRYVTRFVRSGRLTTLGLSGGGCSGFCRTTSSTTTPVSIDLSFVHPQAIGMPVPWSLRPSLRKYFLYLMEAGQTRKCQNPDCPSPYFSLSVVVNNIAHMFAHNRPKGLTRETGGKRAGNSGAPRGAGNSLLCCCHLPSLRPSRSRRAAFYHLGKKPQLGDGAGTQRHPKPWLGQLSGYRSAMTGGRCG